MAAIQVASDMKEIKTIEGEIKRVMTILKTLRSKKKELEERVLSFLESTNHEAIKCDELIAINKQKKYRERKKREEKDKDILEVLYQAGVQRPEDILCEIKDTIRGRERKVPTLKVINESNLIK